MERWSGSLQLDPNDDIWDGARELANSSRAIVPQQERVVWTKATNCPGQLATSFVLDPEAELDLSCLNARRPLWTLPNNTTNRESTDEG